MNLQREIVLVDNHSVSVKNWNDQELVERFHILVKTERKITFQILSFIIELENRRLPALLGFPSTHMYLVKAHGYSEASAQRRIQSARLLKECPQIGDSIQSGQMNMTQLHQVQTLIRQKETESESKVDLSTKLEILASLASKTTLETEKVLVQALDIDVKILESVRPQKDDSFYLGFNASKELMAKIEEVKSLSSHVKHNSSLAQTIEWLCDFALEKKSPNRSVRERRASMTQSHSVTEWSRHIPSKIRRQVLALHPCCQYVSEITGHKCESRFQLQVDHIIPYSISHDHSPENLRVLCRAHNLTEAQRWGFDIPKRKQADCKLE